MRLSTCRAVAVTPATPGAVTILQLHGDVEPILQAVTGQDTWAPGDLRLCDLGRIDEGLVSMLSPVSAQMMPHGGVRIRQRLLEHLATLGVDVDSGLNPAELYPESADGI